MKKLLTILGAVGLTATGASVVVSCSNDPVTPTGPVLALGDITIAGTASNGQYRADAKNKEGKTNSEVIIATFKAKNKDLTVSDKAIVKGITLKGAKIEDGDKTYNVTYTGKAEGTPEESKPISEIVKVSTLGELVDGEDATVLAKVEELNSDAKGLIKIKSNDKKGSAVVEALDATKYTGEITLTFTIKEEETPEESKPITEIVKVSTLGELVDGEDATVLAKVEELNSDAKGLIKIKSNDKKGSAVVEALDATKYTGEITLTFTIKEDGTL